MRFVLFICLAFHLHCAFSQYSHDLLYMVGCFYNGTTQVHFEGDGNLVFYIDFENHEVVFTTPTFAEVDTSPFTYIYRNALKGQKSCLIATAVAKDMINWAPEEKDPPENILYPAEEVKAGVLNQLICFVDHFYPPVLKVKWTKNNSPVSEGVSFSQYYINNDRTFHYFSSLVFTPKQGDVYSCTVEHSALETPKTRMWDVDLNEQSTLDRALDFYCGLGLTVALLGVVVGTYLIVKGRNC